jgi:hypothetical protein
VSTIFSKLESKDPRAAWCGAARRGAASRNFANAYRFPSGHDARNRVPPKVLLSPVKINFALVAERKREKEEREEREGGKVRESIVVLFRANQAR